MGQGVLQQEDGAAQVHAEALLPGFRSDLAERERERVGGVVHEDVDTAEALHRRVDQPVELIELARVGRDSERFAAGRLDLRDGRVAGGLLAARDDHLRARQRIGVSDCAADTPRAPGHDRDPVVEAKQSVELLPVHEGWVNSMPSSVQ